MLGEMDMKKTALLLSALLLFIGAMAACTQTPTPEESTAPTPIEAPEPEHIPESESGVGALTGRWQLVEVQDLTPEEFQAQIEQGGRMEIWLSPDGAGFHHGGDWANPDLLFAGENFRFDFTWRTENGRFIQDFEGPRAEEIIEYHVSGSQLTLFAHWTTLIFERIEPVSQAGTIIGDVVFRDFTVSELFAGPFFDMLGPPLGERGHAFFYDGFEIVASLDDGAGRFQQLDQILFSEISLPELGGLSFHDAMTWGEVALILGHPLEYYAHPDWQNEAPWKTYLLSYHISGSDFDYGLQFWFENLDFDGGYGLLRLISVTRVF